MKIQSIWKREACARCKASMHCKACKEGKAKAVGVDEGNRELTTQLSRFSFHVPAHSCNVLVLVNEE